MVFWPPDNVPMRRPLARISCRTALSTSITQTGASETRIRNEFVSFALTPNFAATKMIPAFLGVTIALVMPAMPTPVLLLLASSTENLTAVVGRTFARPSVRYIAT